MFQPLPAARDIAKLEPVLKDPRIGDYNVDKLLNEPRETVREKIEEFFADRRTHDLLLLYFSCHGVLDDDGRLYFVATDTRPERLGSTGISARWVKEQMDQSRSQRIVLLLDCCYSGAFARGPERRSTDASTIIDQLGGTGRVVITASDKMQCAYESKFTDALVQGLETGDADTDRDGKISVNELYQYVYNHVSQNSPGQTPTKSEDNLRGNFYLAKNPNAIFPEELVAVLTSKTAWKRSWAVDGLRYLLTENNPEEQRIAAQQELAHLRDVDEDSHVQVAAHEALRRPTRRRPGIPDHRFGRYRWLVGIGLTLAVMMTYILSWPPWPSTEATSANIPVPCSLKTKPGNGLLAFGTLLPKSGSFIYAGPAREAAVQLAIKEIKDAGGPGMPVTLDDLNKLDEGNPSTDDIVSRSTDALLPRVGVIIGPATSQSARNVIDKVTCAGVIMFSPSATSSLFTTNSGSKLFFRTAPSSKLEGRALGNLVAEDGNLTAVVLSRNDEYGSSLRNDTVQAIQALGLSVPGSFSYDANAQNYKQDIQRIKKINPDAIVVIGFRESAQVLAEMVNQGLGPERKRVYVSGASMTNTLVRRASPENPSVLAGVKGTPLAEDPTFDSRLKEDNPDLKELGYAAQAYDAVMITALAAAVAGTDAPSAIAQKINSVTKVGGQVCKTFAECMKLNNDHRKFSYVGPSGPLDFTNAGEPRAGTYAISKVNVDGTVNVIKNVTVNY